MEKQNEKKKKIIIPLKFELFEVNRLIFYSALRETSRTILRGIDLEEDVDSCPLVGGTGRLGLLPDWG